MQRSSRSWAILVLINRNLIPVVKNHPSVVMELEKLKEIQGNNEGNDAKERPNYKDLELIFPNWVLPNFEGKSYLLTITLIAFRILKVL